MSDAPGWQQALDYHQQGKLQEASYLYGQFLNHNPNHAQVLHLMGICSGQAGQYDQALHYLNQALHNQPNEASFHNSIANVYQLTKRADQALSHYQRAIELKPNNPSAYNNLGIIKFQQNKLAEAIGFLERALSLKANFADAYYNLALCQLKRKHRQKAFHSIQQALKHEPDNLKSALLFARLAHEQKKFKIIITQLEPLVTTYAEEAHLFQSLGCAYLALDQQQQAIDHFQKAVNLNPDLSEAHHNLGSCYLFKRNLEKARLHWLNVVRLDPQAESYYNVGVVYQYEQRHLDAVHYFSEAINKEPKYFESHINLASTYLKLNQRANAKKHYQIAQSLRPDDPSLGFILSGLNQQNCAQNKQASPPQAYVAELFDQYAPFFDQQVTEQLHYQTPSHLNKAIKSHLSMLPFKEHGYDLIDLGCGTGLAAQACKALAHKLIGIDLSKKMIQQAKSKGLYDQLIHADLMQGLKSCEPADIIIACDTLPYLGDLKPLCNLVAQKLNPEGLFALTVEILDDNDTNYTLQETLRFAHSKRYLEAILKPCFSFLAFEQIILRQQFEQDVPGYLCLAQKNK
jgi:predicted TPR repeat methyltransferase